MSLVTQISNLAVAIRTKLNAMTPRLLPSGGVVGQYLLKNSSTDYDCSWKTDHQQAIVTIPTGITTGRVTWAYPIAYASGVVPVIQAIVVKPTTSSGISYNVQLYGDPTNTTVTLEVNAVNSSLVVGVLNSVLTIFSAAPAGTKVHVYAKLP